MTKLTLSSLLVAAALAAVPASADAATAKFTATYEGTLQTDWDQPRHLWGTQDCFRRPWKRASGSETWSVKTRGKKEKLLVTSTRSGLSWRPGTHSTYGDTDEVLAGGLIKRTASTVSGWDAGPCEGAQGGIDRPRPDDCGTLLPSYALQFSAPYNARFGLAVWPLPASTARNEKQHFQNCTLIVEDSLTPGAWPGSEHAAKVNRAKLFGKQRTIVIKDRRQWTQVLYQGRPSQVTTKSTLTWRLTLRRVR